MSGDWTTEMRKAILDDARAKALERTGKLDCDLLISDITEGLVYVLLDVVSAQDELMRTQTVTIQELFMLTQSQQKRLEAMDAAMDAALKKMDAAMDAALKKFPWSNTGGSN